MSEAPVLQPLGHADYVSLTMEFRCNLRCVHCMIEGTMDRLRPESDGQFEEVLRLNRRERRWRGLILTGSEITLRKDLPQLVGRARACGFERVRIQTHGMHLGQPSYARRLVEAGVNEFFVSIAGADAASHDGITLVKGSFERALRGLAFLDTLPGVLSITNTVVTRLSYPLLPGIVAALSELKRLAQMEFWVYFPMAERDEKDLVARHGDVLPHLRAAIADARALGRKVEVKNFPQCLLGELGDALVNAQPELHIDEDFWTEFARNGFYQCVHRDACASTECLGLNSAYLAKFGDEAETLSPLNRVSSPPSGSTIL